MPVAIAKMFGSKMMSSGGKPALRVEQAVGALADLDLALERVGLALLVEGHHDRRRAVPPHERRLAQERRLAFLERDRVDDRLSLHALQPRLDHLPFRRVDHHRHAGDVGFGGDQVQESDHRRPGVEHRLVHVDVDHLRAARDLLARDLDGARVIAGENQLRERPRASDVGALADIDEERFVADVERLEAGKAHDAGHGERANPMFFPLPCGGEGVGRRVSCPGAAMTLATPNRDQAKIKRSRGPRRSGFFAAAMSSPLLRSRGCVRGSSRSSRRRD